MSGIDREAFLDGYLAEAEDHVSAVARHLSAIGGSGPSAELAQPRAVRDIFRSLHTIKGLSAMVGVEPIVDIAHAMEAVVRAGEKSGGRLAATAIDLLVDGIRAIEQRLRLVAERRPVPPAPLALLEALSATERPTTRAPVPSVVIDEAVLTASEREQIAQAVAAGSTCTRLDIMPSPERAAAGLTITTVRERVGQIAEIVRVVPKAMVRDERAPAGLAFALYVLHDAAGVGAPAALAEAAGIDVDWLVLLASPPVASLATTAAEPTTAPTPEPIDELLIDAALAGDDGESLVDVAGGRFVRVEVSRLDDVLERLSALIVTRFRLSRAVAELAAAGVDVRAVQGIVHDSARQLRGLRAAVMRARMVAVADLLERVPLTVRGLSRSMGKLVAVDIDAGRAELDKGVGERIVPAIIHVVRNAVDHGIESPAERQSRGKPAEGRIRVSCHERNNNQLELVISDDGRGIDRAALARRAGRAVPDSDDALLELLAIPGLSSRSEATTTSGRGVGVDIVLRVVRDLGGELQVTSRAGEGTTFTMRIPLSISIVEAFSFESAGQIFLVPVAAIDEIVEVDPAQTTRAPQRPGLRAEVSLIERRGVAVPLVALDEVFSLVRPAGTALVATGLNPKAIVVRRGGELCAFRIDRVLGQQEVVVRPLVDELVKMTGVTGSTDLGDGKPVLVLDLVALADHLIDPTVVQPW